MWNDVAGNICQALAHTAHHLIGSHLTHETRIRIRLDNVAGQADIARRVIGSHLTPETRVQSAFDDVAGDVCLSPQWISAC